MLYRRGNTGAKHFRLDRIETGLGEFPRTLACNGASNFLSRFAPLIKGVVLSVASPSSTKLAQLMSESAEKRALANISNKLFSTQFAAC